MSEAQKQRDNALSRIKFMESQHSNNKLAMCIFELRKKYLKGSLTYKELSDAFKTTITHALNKLEQAKYCYYKPSIKSHKSKGNNCSAVYIDEFIYDTEKTTQL